MRKGETRLASSWYQQSARQAGWLVGGLDAGQGKFKQWLRRRAMRVLGRVVGLQVGGNTRQVGGEVHQIIQSPVEPACLCGPAYPPAHQW